MIHVVDIALGALLGVSVSLLIIVLASQRRSGLASLLLVSVGLGIHASFTLAILLLGHYTQVLSNIEGYYLLVLDVAMFVVAILVGVLGGKGIAGPS